VGIQKMDNSGLTSHIHDTCETCRSKMGDTHMFRYTSCIFKQNIETLYENFNIERINHILR
jgi:hypothetical protein